VVARIAAGDDESLNEVQSGQGQALPLQDKAIENRSKITAHHRSWSEKSIHVADAQVDYEKKGKKRTSH
jgi:hypothetical protein